MEKLEVKITVKALFSFIAIMKKIEFDYKGFLKDLDNKGINKQEDAGLELFSVLFNGIDKAENEVYVFLGIILDIDTDIVKELDLFTDIAVPLKEYKGWKVFFTNVAKS